MRVFFADGLHIGTDTQHHANDSFPRLTRAVAVLEGLPSVCVCVCQCMYIRFSFNWCSLVIDLLGAICIVSRVTSLPFYSGLNRKKQDREKRFKGVEK